MVEWSAADVRGLRLRSQRLGGGHPARDPVEVARWFGAMQAQEVASGLWSLGARVPGATAADVSAVDAAEKLPPPPPWEWVSTKPGITVTAPSSRSALRGGGPAPTAVTFPPDRSIHPGRNNSAPAMSVSAVSSTQMPCQSGFER